MHSSNRNYLVIDLEATCWEQDDPTKGVHEIIEIGLVILSSSKEDLWKESWFIKPVLNPQLSTFCKGLTTIQQEQIDSAEKFPQVLQRMERRIVEITGQAISESLFVSWGNYDRNQFQKDCLLHDCQYPFGGHCNLKQVFMKQHKLKHAGLSGALQLLELPMLGTPHRGIDDALNTARILKRMERVF